MTNGFASTRAPAARDARLAWGIGGGMLAAYAALPLLFRGVPVPGLSQALDLLWALSLLVFAFGIRGSGSVVGRRAGGVAALVVAAVVPLALRWVALLVVPTTTLTGVALSPMPPNLPALQPQPDLASDTAWTISSIVGEAGSILCLVAPLVAAFMIGRAGALARRVRWLPLIAIACGPAVGLLGQLILVAQSNQNLDGLFWVFNAGTVLTALGYLLLGILAAAFASQASALLGGSAQPAGAVSVAEG